MTTHRVSSGEIITDCCMIPVSDIPAGDYATLDSLHLVDCKYDKFYCGGCHSQGSHKRDCPLKTIHIKTKWQQPMESESVRNVRNIICDCCGFQH